VTWRGPLDVIAFVSHSPDDAGTAIVDPDGPRVLTVRLDDEADRRYVHLFVPGEGFVVGAERLVPLVGTYNFRDIGGYPVGGGGFVRWGRVFRSDHLADLTTEDLDRLRQLGVRSVVDVRGPHEHKVAPSALLDGGAIDRFDWAIGDGAVAGVPLNEQVQNATINAFTVEDMTALYLDILDGHADVFARILDLVAKAEDAGSGPPHAVVYHCTAGKDRTGLATVLLLELLGVDEPTILDDFELTNRYRSLRRVEEVRPELDERGIDIDRFLPLFTAQRPAMAAALVATRAEHGTFERYLVERGGLDPGVPERLRERLLTIADGI
jgi:protein-tyrosine phosphatase